MLNGNLRKSFCNSDDASLPWMPMVDSCTKGPTDNQEEKLWKESLKPLQSKTIFDIYNLLVGVLLCFSNDYVPYEILF